MRRWLCALALVLLGSSCGQGAPDTSIHLGVVYPLSGPQAPGGREELDGIRAALQVARQRHLPLADRIQLAVRDVRTPEEAAAAVDTFAASHLPVVLGTYGSTLSQAAATRADERHVVFWETGAVADPVTTGHRYVFRTVATGSTLGRTAAEFTAEVLIPANGAGTSRRVAIVAVDDVYGRSVSDEEVARARELGIQVAAILRYDPHLYDPQAIAAQLVAVHPDYLWDVSYVDDGIAIWHEVVQSGLHLRGVVGTSSAFCMSEFGNRLGREAVGVFAADKPDDQVNRSALAPAAVALLDDARRAYRSIHGGSTMEIPGVAGFVGGWTLFHDVLPRIRGPITPDSVRQAALTVDVPMGEEINGGGVRFAPPGATDSGQNQRAVAVVGQWQGIGVMRVVYPAAFATASPVIPEGDRWPAS
jgi:branched-chain amino acid transport system substrate-binding protein